ncbi:MULTISPECIES: M13 family metallopeptidase [Acidobacteriaceae]|uniref:M13 family metallopeptidase n=1 Tax=Acidobacteriaceae TaxID=204434 RepID=UPI00131D9161|nr:MULTISPECIES: M13 family metallopeptidase [Acidobacteriaceae]MDW5267815.1 M13 family metallopeptidase [Edaphobacter sp.]
MTFKSFAAFLVLSSGLCLGQTSTPAGQADTGLAPTSVPKKPISFDLSGIDKTADPCTDFYQYACGSWKKENPIPADQTRWGRFNELAERNNYLLYQDLKTAADAPKTPLQKKYGDYFAACMNVNLANQLGAKPIDPALKTIADWNDKKTLATLLGTMEDKYAVGFFFDFGSEQDQKDSTQQIGALDQGGLGLPDRDYYLNQDERSKTLREQYVAHVTKMFVLLGDTPAQAATEAQNVMTVETALAQGSMARVDRRNPANVYHVMTIAQLQDITPDFNWKVYLDAKKEGSLETANIVSPGFFKAMQQQIDATSVDALKSYMRWHTVHRFAANLSAPFVEENFNFYGATLTGQKEITPRWKRCTAATDRAMGEAVGQDWVARNFPPAAKDNMEKLVHALEVSLGQDIQHLDWMSDATKVQAQKKLEAFREKIGYPDKWRDYSPLTVKRDDPVGNAERASAFDDRHDLNKIGKPVDEKEWGMTPPTVNAYYNPAMNDINFPAGILQPPFYDFKIDPAVNFGGIGIVIGHEMTHGFDDQGSQYDAQGNVRSWWTPEDKKKFDERTDCEAKEYDNFEVAPGQKLNGRLTLGENTADNGGLRIAYAALMSTLAEENKSADKSTTEKIDGYTPEQRYFISWGQVWCENTREQAARLRAKTDPHSSGQWRVNGSVQNFDEFGKAFGCKVGQPMMPEKSCQVW